jgi:beta-galactosidase GanA
MMETQPHLSYIQGFEGACLALYLNNVTFTVVSEKDSFSGFSTIIVPMGICLEEKTIARLLAFVAEGGKLVLEAGAGMFDGNGLLNTAIPGGADFSEAAGVHETDILYAKRFEFDTPCGTLGGVEERRLARVSAGTQALANWSDGAPAITRSEYGKGTIIYTSTYVTPYIRTSDIAACRTFAELM